MFLQNGRRGFRDALVDLLPKARTDIVENAAAEMIKKSMMPPGKRRISGRHYTKLESNKLALPSLKTPEADLSVKEIIRPLIAKRYNTLSALFYKKKQKLKRYVIANNT